MAGDWIKMRVSLSTHPKVLALADHLNANGKYIEWQDPACAIPGASFGPDDEAEQARSEYAALRVTRYVTVAALLRFWGYANEHADAEFIRGLRLADIDEITGVPGFGEALALVGWAEQESAPHGVRLPNFSEFNSIARERSKNADRQRRYRERHANASSDGSNNSGNNAPSNVTVTLQRREEKRREESKEKDLPGKPDCADDFSTWYKAYPRHEARDDAQRAWDKRRKAGELPPLAFMLAQIEWQVREGCLKPATADGRSLVPLPATYLNKGKFKDEPPRTYVAPPRKFTPCTTDGCVGEGLVVWGGKCQVCYIQSKPARVAA